MGAAGTTAGSLVDFTLATLHRACCYCEKRDYRNSSETRTSLRRTSGTPATGGAEGLRARWSLEALRTRETMDGRLWSAMALLLSGGMVLALRSRRDSGTVDGDASADARSRALTFLKALRAAKAS